MVAPTVLAVRPLLLQERNRISVLARGTRGEFILACLSVLKDNSWIQIAAFLYNPEMTRVSLLLTLGAFLALPAISFAQNSINAVAATPPPPATKPAPAPRPPPLTKDETAEINKAYADAVKTNPDLLTEQTDIKDKQKALADQQKQLNQKVDAALIQADPNLATVIAAHPNGIRPSLRPAPKPPNRQLLFRRLPLLRLQIQRLLLQLHPSQPATRTLKCELALG